MKPRHLFAIYENATKDTGKDCAKFKTKFIRFEDDTQLYYNEKLHKVSAGKGLKVLVKRKGIVYADHQPIEIEEI